MAHQAPLWRKRRQETNLVGCTFTEFLLTKFTYFRKSQEQQIQSGDDDMGRNRMGLN